MLIRLSISTPLQGTRGTEAHLQPASGTSQLLHQHQGEIAIMQRIGHPNIIKLISLLYQFVGVAVGVCAQSGSIQADEGTR